MERKRSFRELAVQDKKKQNVMTPLEITIKFLRSFFYPSAELDEAYQSMMF